MNCKSCGHILSENAKYCDNCGGKVVITRLTLKAVLAEFFTKFFSWDNKFWTTIKALIQKPEEVFNVFINGGRKKYFHPFTLVVITGAIYALAINYSPLKLPEYNEQNQMSLFKTGTKIGSGNSEEVQRKVDQNSKKMLVFIGEVQKKANDIMQKNTNYVNLISIPLYALISFLIFLSFKKNFAENLVFQSYITSISNLFFTPIVLIGFFTEINFWLFSGITILFLFVFTNYCYKRFYNLNIKQLMITNLKFFIIGLPIYMIGSFILSFILMFIIVLIGIVPFPKLS